MAGRHFHWIRPRSMRARLGIVAVITILTICGGLVAWREFELQQAREQTSTVLQERQRLCEKVVRERSARLHVMVCDFAEWPEFKSALAGTDTRILESHALPAARRRSASFRLIDRNGKTIFESKGLPKTLGVRPHWYTEKFVREKSMGGQFPGFLNAPPKATFPQLQYFFFDEGKLYESAISPLYGKVPTEKSTPIGYVVACQPWSAQTLQNLGQLTDTRVEFKPLAKERIQKLTESTTGLRVDIPGIDAPPLGDLVFEFKSDFVISTVDRTRQRTFIFAGLTMIVCACFIMLTQRWFVAPIQKMGVALEEGTPDPVENLVDDPTELGHVANALVENFSQKKRLEFMACELKVLNESLRNANDEVTKSNCQLLKINEILEARVQERTVELSKAYEATIVGWSKAMDSRDQETEGHTQRVAKMALLLAKSMGLTPKQQQDIYYGALVHDIGKIGIPDAILLKNDKLSVEEFEVMKSHTRLAHEMLKDIEFLKDSIEVPLCHHERWDGEGYPNGLAGEEIPFLARVFAVADVWDALRSHRPYRAAWSEKETREYITSQSGTHFDPKVVEAFLALEPMSHPTDEPLDGQRLPFAA